MNLPSVAQIAAGETVASTIAPAFGPNGVLAVSIANALLSLAVQASSTGVDVTDAEIASLLGLDDEAKVADLAAQRAILAGA